MRFVADESLDFPIVTALRNAGHDVFSIKEQSPRMEDDAILKIANEQKRILLTCDKDFGELVLRAQTCFPAARASFQRELLRES